MNASLTIGTLTTKKFINKLLKQKSLTKENVRLKFYALVNESKKAKTDLFFFSINDVNIKKLTIFGTYYNEEKKKWLQKNFPFPDVFYNQIARGLDNPGRPFRQLRRKLMEQGVTQLNSKNDFDKWELYKELSKIEEVDPYLPRTKRFYEYEDLKNMIHAHPSVYVKSIHGRRGKAIMKIIKDSPRGFRCLFYSSKLEIYKVDTLRKVLKIVKKFFGDKTLLIQQAINLSSYTNRIFDMRAEIQRDGRGNIRIAGIPVRVGQKDSPVTSSRTKSEIYPFETFFREKLGYSRREYRKLLKKVNLFLETVYKNTEKIYGPFGELGIDFGLDQQGRLWLIECNATSGKKAFIQAYNEDTIMESKRVLLEYAKGLIDEKNDFP
ncbi:hypothetical protein J2S74_002734 [Evansella vedderi]|uniref:ATP-grasp domain-containing protein n=1 Tax=Evansella vedderi TaxID=38282 RepID=A0ABT9ZVV2_9BACI|nr:YheC/YheD family protein [Evansella vedderi]MDQ0255352.1 hypothetical protein [Evansella vedderi]